MGWEGDYISHICFARAARPLAGIFWNFWRVTITIVSPGGGHVTLRGGRYDRDRDGRSKFQKGSRRRTRGETGGTTAGRRLAADARARPHRGNTEPAQARGRPPGRSPAPRRAEQFFVDVAAAGLGSAAAPVPCARGPDGAGRTRRSSTRQKQHVFAIISEQTELDLDQEDDEGAFVDVDFGTLDAVTLWKLHAYIYSRLCFGPMLARTHGLRYERRLPRVSRRSRRTRPPEATMGAMLTTSPVEPAPEVFGIVFDSPELLEVIAGYARWNHRRTFRRCIA